jgi:transketolase
MTETTPPQINQKLQEMDAAKDIDMPRIIFAKTTKGKGFSVMENKPNWHYWNNLSKDQIEQCRKEIN